MFLVGSLGDGSCAEILFEPESLRGDSPPSRGEGQRIAPTISSRTSGGGGLGTDFDCDVGLVQIAAPSEKSIPTLARCDTAREGQRKDFETETLVPIAFSSKDHGADAGKLSPTLRALNHRDSHMNGGGQVAIAFHPTQDPISSTDGSTHALGCGSKQGAASVAVAFKPSHFTRDKDGPPSDIAPPLSADADKGDQEPVVFQECQTGVREYGSAGTLRAGGPGHDPVGSRVRSGMAVRRLTPRECERLMNWPDDHTTGFSDSVRYKMCGNGVVASCSEWIGRRIVRFSPSPVIP